VCFHQLLLYNGEHSATQADDIIPDGNLSRFGFAVFPSNAFKSVLCYQFTPGSWARAGLPSSLHLSIAAEIGHSDDALIPLLENAISDELVGKVIGL